MKKSQLYNQAKNLAARLGVQLQQKWLGSTKVFWENEIVKYKKELAKSRIPFGSELITAVALRKARLITNAFNTRIVNLINSNRFQNVINIVINENKNLTTAQANMFFNKIVVEGRYVITLSSATDEKIVSLNLTTRDFITHLLKNGMMIDEIPQFGSDTINEFNLEELTNVSITRLVAPTRVMPNRDGRFFPHINTTNLDLSRYQMFNQNQAYSKAVMDKREHCLLHSLSMSGVNKSKINEIKLMYARGVNIKKKDIRNICNIIKRKIIIHTLKPDNKINKQVNTPFDIENLGEDVNIALHENHYFIFEKTIFSKYFINNYNNICNVENNHKIVRVMNGKYIRSEKAKINSLLLSHKLLSDNLFVKLDLVLFEEAASHQNLKDHIYLDNIENEQQLITVVEKSEKSQKVPKVFYADCESYVEGEHKLQLLGVASSVDDNVSIYNVCDNLFKSDDLLTSEQLVVYEFLKNITNNGKQNALCYFHNLKYDYHLLEQYINIKSKCEKDKQIYSVVILYKGCEIELRDSYKLIPFPLAKFQSEFNLPKEFGKKEAISYEYYKKENNDIRIDTNEYRKLLAFADQKTFDINMRSEPSYLEDNTFNPMDYYKEYLRLDCLVLKKGIEKFNGLISEITGGKMNVFSCLTISSLTDKFMIAEGCYDNVFEIKGNLRAYVAKAVYGGRVCVNEKYVKTVIDGKIADYDGVSLYPSAIHRLCREIGLATGEAKRFDETNPIGSWRNMCYSVMTVKITKVNKLQQMPFIAHKGENSIKYSNSPPENDIVIDSITLEDYIKFHEIEYELKEGVYWNSGTNKKMGDVIKRLFDERVKIKKSNKALANVIKLMLNSAYGKTIMKKSFTKKKIVKLNTKKFVSGEWINIKKNDYNSYVYNNFNTIKSIRKLNNDNCEFEQICSDSTYNRGHIGCSILSMSKRIMNEVFDVANDMSCAIYYTDTDSLHCNVADLHKLEGEYKTRYNKELNGTSLEQFHTDFALDGACGEIYATKSIFLGKKSYIDILESVDNLGNIITGTHIRLKGITTEGLEHAAKEYDNGHIGLYEDLSKGIEKKFILNPFNIDTNKNKVLFEFKQGRVSTRKEFIRKVKF